MTDRTARVAEQRRPEPARGPDEHITVPGMEITTTVLGRGANSVVLLGHRDGTDFAVKVLAPSDTAEQRVAVRREAALLASIEHHGLVRVHEAGEASRRPYVVMDHVDGESLASLLRSGTVDEARAVTLALEVADALGAAHRAGLVHRDIKPDNIMLAADGSVRLIDFGLAAHAGAAVDDVAAGTFAYSAPEQTGALRRAVDGRADLYSLGVVLYECLTGAPPFAAEDAGELMRQHLVIPAPDLRTVAPDVTGACAAVVATLLAKDPDDRYRTAESLRADLARIAAGDVDGFRPATTHAEAGGTPAALIGRERELELLVTRWRRAVAGAGGAVVVTGQPGQGKSLLAAGLTSVAASGGRIVLQGRCSPDDAEPFAVFRRICERYVRDLGRRPEPERSAAARVLATIAEDTGNVLGALTPVLTSVLADARPAPEGQPDQLVAAVAALLAGLARAHDGLLVQLDNVQWCDEGSLRIVRRLTADLTGTPLLLVVCARDETDGGASLEANLGDALDLRIAVEPLPEPALAAVVTSRLGSSTVPPALLSTVASRSGGSPTAALEHVRAILDAGLLSPYWGSWQLDEDGLAALELPDDVLELVLQRVDGLGADARDLLTVAATMGTRFVVTVAAAVAGLQPDPVATALTEAVGHRFIESSGPGNYLFLHERIREALLTRVDEDHRRRLHRRIAEELERELEADPEQLYQVARHYIAGGTEHHPERVYRAAAAAGALALNRYAAADALKLLTSAAEAAAAAGLTPAPAFDVDLGRAAWRAGKLDLAATAFERALAGDSDPLRRARLHFWRATVEATRWQFAPAVDLCQMGLAELGHRLPRTPIGMVVSTLALLVWGIVLGKVPPGRRRVDGERAERLRLRAELLQKVAHCMALAKRYPVSTAMDIQSLHLTQRLRPCPEHSRTLSGLAMPLAAMRLYRLAGRLFDAAATEAALVGDPRAAATVRFMRAAGEDLMPPMGARSGNAMREVLLAEGQWLEFDQYTTAVGFVEEMDVLRGHHRRAADLHRRAMARVRGETRDLVGPLAVTGAQIAALSGQPAEAARELRLAREAGGSATIDAALAPSIAVAAAQAAIEQGDHGAAFEQAVAEFRRLGLAPGDVSPVQRAFWVHQAFGRLAQVATAPPEQRAEHLAMAERAVGELRRAANGPVLQAFHVTAQASLRHLRGDHAGALRRLHESEERRQGLDVPLVDFEVARIRARALHALGLRADAQVQARVALLYAAEHDWPTRARWVRTEFEVADGGDSPLTNRRSGLATGVRNGHLVERRIRAVQQVGAAAATVLDPRQVARIALDEIVGMFAAERAFVFLSADDPGDLVPYLGRDTAGADLSDLTGYGSTLVRRVHHSGAPLVVTGSEEGAALGSRSTLVHGLRSIMVAPLILKGRALGVVYLDSRAAKGIFTSEDVDILAAITNHIATSLETARAAQLEVAVHAAQRERDVAQLLRGAMTELAGSLDPADLSRRLITTVGRALRVDAAVLLQHAPGTAVRSMARWGGPAGDEPVDAPLRPEDDAVLAELLASPVPCSGHRDEGPPPLPAQLGADLATWVSFPLHIRGERQATLVLGRTDDHRYSEAEVEIATALVGQGAVALENAWLFARVEQLAMRDGLTGLFNRRHFAEFARQRFDSERHSRPLGAIMIDIDHFKQVNDTYGHSVGDEVIKEVATRLGSVLRADDIICRYGGEEFAVLLTESGAGQAAAAAARLHEVVRRTPVTTQAGPLAVTVSVGLAGTVGEPSSDPGLPSGDAEALLELADRALYDAKRQGRNRVAVYSDGEPSTPDAAVSGRSTTP